MWNKETLMHENDTFNRIWLLKNRLKCRNAENINSTVYYVLEILWEEALWCMVSSYSSKSSQRVLQTHLLNVLTYTHISDEYTAYQYKSKYLSFVLFISLFGWISTKRSPKSSFWALGQTWNAVFQGWFSVRCRLETPYLCYLMNVSCFCAILQSHRTSIFVAPVRILHQPGTRRQKQQNSVQLFQPTGQVQTHWVPKILFFVNVHGYFCEALVAPFTWWKSGNPKSYEQSRPCVALLKILKYNLTFSWSKI